MPKIELTEEEERQVHLSALARVRAVEMLEAKKLGEKWDQKVDRRKTERRTSPATKPDAKPKSKGLGLLT